MSSVYHSVWLIAYIKKLLIWATDLKTATSIYDKDLPKYRDSVRSNPKTNSIARHFPIINIFLSLSRFGFFGIH